MDIKDFIELEDGTLLYRLDITGVIAIPSDPGLVDSYRLYQLGYRAQILCSKGLLLTKQTPADIRKLLFDK